MQRCAVSFPDKTVLAAANIAFARRRRAMAYKGYRWDKSAMLAAANIELEFGFPQREEEESTRRRSRQGGCRR